MPNPLTRCATLVNFAAGSTRHAYIHSYTAIATNQETNGRIPKRRQGQHTIRHNAVHTHHQPKLHRGNDRWAETTCRDAGFQGCHSPPFTTIITYVQREKKKTNQGVRGKIDRTHVLHRAFGAQEHQQRRRRARERAALSPCAATGVGET